MPASSKSTKKPTAAHAKSSTGANKSDAASKGTKPATESSGVLKYIIVLLVVLLAVGVNFYRGDDSAPPAASPTPVASPATGNDGANDADIDLSKHLPKREVVEGVELSTITLSPTTGDDMEVVGERTVDKHSAQDKATAAAWVASVHKTLDAYSDDRAPVPIEYSSDAHVAKVERIAVYLRDHYALAEFMAFPYAPHTLELSPTLSSFDVVTREALRARLFRNVRARIDDSYWTHQRISNSFRESMWATYTDFQSFLDVSVEDFLALSAMERALAAKNLAPENELFDNVNFVARNNLLWAALDDVIPKID